MSPLSNDKTPLLNIRPEQSVHGTAANFQFVVEALLGRLHTLQLAQVMAVNADNTCSIKPLVMKIDGNNDAYERGTITNVPYFISQGGGNAVIIPPKVGDIGLAAFCERDISMVKRNKAEAPPDTRRMYDLNDALYFGGFLNGAPTQYIQFLDSGINIKSTGDININGLKISPSGQLTFANGVVADTHIHSQGSDSHGDSEQDTGVPHG